VSALVKDEEEKGEYVALFLLGLYNHLNRIYIIDENQDVEEKAKFIAPFFWKIDENWDVGPSRFIRN